MNQHNAPNTDKKSTTINPGGNDKFGDKNTYDEKTRQAQKSPDKGLVGQDTDGDGKVVKPGQAPGQSHGKGLPENKH